MDNFNSWQSLGSRFRKLQPAQGDRLCAAWDAMDQSWFLRNRPDSKLEQDFKDVVEDAAGLWSEA